MIELTIIITTVIAAGVGAISALIVERYRNKLQAISRYREPQLNLYIKLWHFLYDLKVVADRLWEKADILNLTNFIEQLQKTENEINYNLLLIEDNHVNELRRLIKAFWDFQIGKEKLINLRKEREFPKPTKLEIEEAIKHNMQIKEQYDHLVKDIERSFRKQLKTP
jgi:hypothetical protein